LALFDAVVLRCPCDQTLGCCDQSYEVRALKNLANKARLLFEPGSSGPEHCRETSRRADFSSKYPCRAAAFHNTPGGSTAKCSFRPWTVAAEVR